jgi:LPS O-antigen subunit length determinant protein (WzzB/FepE family)
MKTLVRWAARLYPAAWRARYGVEMEALLEDAGSGGGDLWDIVRGALFMQMTSLSFWKILAGCSLAGVLAAGIWSVALPERYVSTAVMRIGGDQPSHDRLQAVELATLSRASLAEIILRPSLNLYSTERKKIPLQDVIEEMRSRDLRIRQVDSTTFAVQFASENPGTAQATVRALVDRLMERNAAVARDPGSGAAAMEVVNPATLPPQPEGPQRRRVMGSGLGAGLLLGLGCGTIWSITRRKERWNLRRIGGFAAAGMALGVTIAWLIPNEFVSTAVLRTADGSKLQSAVAQALSEESLAAIIREEGIFSRELRRNSMNDVARKMRHDFIRVQVVQAEPAAAVTISFRYWDRLQAQQVTRDLVWRLVGPQTGNEVVDPPNLPATPVYPNRLNIAVLGTVAGILLGLTASRFRRPKLATA